MVTFEIAKKKDRFLREALELLNAEPLGDDTAELIVASAELLIQALVEHFSMLLLCDESHEYAAVTSEGYPYQQMDEVLETLFANTLQFSVDLLTLSLRLKQQGHHLKSHSQLEKLVTKVRSICEDNEAFYESEAYHRISQNAVEEYEKGWVEGWPV